MLEGPCEDGCAGRGAARRRAGEFPGDRQPDDVESRLLRAQSRLVGLGDVRLRAQRPRRALPFGQCRRQWPARRRRRQAVRSPAGRRRVRLCRGQGRFRRRQRRLQAQGDLRHRVRRLRPRHRGTSARRSARATSITTTSTATSRLGAMSRVESGHDARLAHDGQRAGRVLVRLPGAGCMARSRASPTRRSTSTAFAERGSDSTALFYGEQDRTSLISEPRLAGRRPACEPAAFRARDLGTRRPGRCAHGVRIVGVSRRHLLDARARAGQQLHARTSWAQAATSVMSPAT